MSRRRSTGLLALVLLATGALAAGAESRRYPLPNGTTIELPVPADWNARYEAGTESAPATLTMNPGDGDLFKAEIALETAEERGEPLPEAASIHDLVRKSADSLKRETRMQIREIARLPDTAAEGYYFSAVATETSSGPYPNVTKGLARTGDLLVSFQVSSDDAAAAAVERVLAMVTAIGNSNPGGPIVKSAMRERPASPSEESEFHEYLTRSLDVMYNRSDDIDYVVDHMHPSVVDMSDGEARVRMTIVRARTEVGKANLKLEKVGFPKAATVVTTHQRTYAVIPRRVVLNDGRLRYEGWDFTVAVREGPAGDWRYVDGAGFAGFRASLFADFPADFELPAIERKRQ